MRAGHRHQAVLRVPERVRRRAQHQHLPRLPGPPGLPAGAQPAGGGAGHAAGDGPAVRGAALDLPPEELLLSGHAEGLPGQPVRPAHQCRWPPRPPRRLPGRDHPGPHGGGHGQDHPRGRERAHPRGRLRPGRLQPSRRPPGRDRERTRHPLGRPGPGLRERAAGDPGGDRRVGRPHGGGVAAHRRQCVGAAVWVFGTGDPGRDQEPQLGALAGTGRRLRGPPPDRAAGGGGEGGAGDPALERGRRPHVVDALQGGGLRLPVLPRARSGAVGAVGGVATGGGRRGSATTRRPAAGAGRGRGGGGRRPGGGHGGRPRPRRPGLGGGSGWRRAPAGLEPGGERGGRGPGSRPPTSPPPISRRW